MIETAAQKNFENMRDRRARPTLNKACDQHSIKHSLLGHTALSAWSTLTFEAGWIPPSHLNRGRCEKQNFVIMCQEVLVLSLIENENAGMIQPPLNKKEVKTPLKITEARAHR